MEHLTVHNFGPIKELDINIPRLLVLIGDQATGKSTICKLIYSFRLLSQKIIPHPLLVPPQVPSKIDINVVINTVKNHFITSFDKCYYSSGSSIVYVYSNKNYIKIQFQNDSIDVSLSESITEIFTQYNKTVDKFENNQIFSPRKNSLNQKKLSDYVALQLEIINIIRPLLLTKPTEYIEASRSGSVTPSLGEFTASRSSILSEQILRGCMNLINKWNTPEEEKLLKDVIGPPMNQIVKEQEGYFCLGAGPISSDKIEEKLAIFQRMQRISRQLIGGRLTDGPNGQFELRLTNATLPIPYNCLSSGQKSMIPVITAILAAALQFRSESVIGPEIPFNAVIVEEPESHLFPQNQFLLVLLIATALRYSPLSSFIVTTHTPYILTAIQALIAFSKVKDASKMTIVTSDMTPISSDRSNVEIYYLNCGTARSLREGDSEFFDLTEIDRVSDKINEILDEVSSARFNEDNPANGRS